ncbi:MAG: cell surface protein SprA, partial [Cytophagales bacterium]|nr:cell surface protein SprA [Cytophagales bacterium]
MRATPLIFLVLALLIAPVWEGFGQGKDTEKDSVQQKEYIKSQRPIFNPQDRWGDPFSFRVTRSPFFLKNPGGLKLGYQIDTNFNYNIRERWDNMRYRPRTQLEFEEYNRLHTEQMLKDFWVEQSKGLDGTSAVSGRRLIPPIYISPFFDRIFGGTYVDIVPSGYVNLDLGGRWVRTFNPQVPVSQQLSGGLEFDMQMSLNLIGKIGEKLKVTANFDNNNSFDFQNNMKVEYTGFDEEIIKKIEVGNVSMGVSNSLINGAQNLFGVKAQFQFGRLYWTTVFSDQRGKTESVSIGADGTPGQGNQFNRKASDYDDNRHFFLSHFFRDNYERWLKNLPQVASGVNITRVEVYLINRNNTTTTLRNVVAFQDLGEPSKIYRKDEISSSGTTADNGANSLFGALRRNPDYRDPSRLESALSGEFPSFENSLDYVQISGARKLDREEYYFNQPLGYISLKRKLQNDEMLAVSYEYTYNGQVYKVGELSEDYSKLQESELIFLKLLRPNKINAQAYTWDLMMKNVYSLGVSQIEREGFEMRILYRDDRTGLDNPSLNEGANTKDRPLVHLLGIDKVNQNGDPVAQGDGFFDYIEGITVIPEYGVVVFPILEPFGSDLEANFDSNSEKSLISKYVYGELYSQTKTEAQQQSNKDKFTLQGRVPSGSSSEIALPAFNIPEGSVVVSAGGLPLTEGRDYRVDYRQGTVTIVNQSILTSGKKITVTYEKPDLLNVQSRTLLGNHLEYRFSDDFNIGATALWLRERPIASRVAIGDEPLNNLKYGFNVNYRTESKMLTRMVDALPIISTKEPSTFQFNAEFAQLISGTSNKVTGESTSYIDDFESAVIPYSVTANYIEQWKLAATPKTANNEFGYDYGQDTLALNRKRAKFAWYIIDNVFYRSSSSRKPDNITEDDLLNNYVRAVPPQEIFSRRDQEVINTNLAVFDLAYFPSERGPYNYNTSLDDKGLMSKPEENWGGITKAIKNEVDFDQTNIEYIEFWMLDPFIEGEHGKVRDGVFNENNTTGGKLIFNLGSVSEDLYKNNKHAYENGLSPDGSNVGVEYMSPWGRVSTQAILTRAFDNSESARENQDVGLDGLKNNMEQAFYSQRFLQKLNPQARSAVEADPSADDFRYYLGNYHDERNHRILERYKSYNGLENNSPITTSGTPASNTASPDNEDINQDNTLSTLEEYYYYELDLRKGGLEVGEQYIVDKKPAQHEGQTVNWYLFRIPIRNPKGKVGSIEGFNNIRFLRTYLTGWKQPVVLRMVDFRMVGAQWRKYDGSLYEKGLWEIPKETDNRNLTISAVNVEDNPNYVLPPGINRDRDQSSSIERELNEQSMQLCVEDLEDRDARAAFKNVGLDLVNYERVKMFIHAESETAEDGDLVAFVRIGSDFTDNYYEIEVPLEISPKGDISPESVWPAANEINVPFDALYTLKKARNRAQTDIDLPYTDTYERYKLTIVGKPVISGIQTLMIGLRNPRSATPRKHSACIWVNEFRVTDFNSMSGWAANARMNTKLADFVELNATTQYSTPGFGQIQQGISERTREERLAYDLSARVNLEKLGPDRLGVQIPMFVSYEQDIMTPYYDPLDPDIPLTAALNAFEDPDEREDYKRAVQDRTTRRSISFTNVRKVKRKPDAIAYPFDLENLSFTYAYSDVKRSNYNTESYINKYYRVGVAYQYTPPELIWEPFKNIKSLNKPYLKWLYDFNINFAPASLAVNGDLDRRFVKTQLRNADLSIEGVDPTYDKYFYFNRNYAMRWNLFSSFSLDYTARVNALVDEPYGDIDTKEEKDVIIENLLRLGRTKQFDQTIGATYQLPLSKLPITDWTKVDATYSVNYNWQAGALPDPQNPETYVGNVISNNRQYGFDGKLDFVKLYNKSKYLKSVNSPRKKRKSTRRRSSKDVKDAKAEKEEKEKQKLFEKKGVKGLARLLMSLR